MKILLLYNNFAANKKATEQFFAMEKLLLDNDIDIEVKITDYKHHGFELIRDTDLTNFDAVVGAGGDGTIFELINGLMLNKERIPIGVIPNGTGNAFARDIGLKNHAWKEAIAAIKRFKTKKIDIGEVKTPDQTFYFGNIIGFGFVTDVARSAGSLKMFGGASYTIGVLYHTIFLNTFKLKIELDGKILDREAVFVEISNTRYTGKDFLMAPEAKMDDGLFDITLLNKCSRTKIITCLPKIFTGDHVHLDVVETFKASKIKFETDSPKILTPDGEIFGSTPITISCLPGAVEVITNL